jgi:uncharacterized phiE125 gp8 family phage protein
MYPGWYPGWGGGENWYGVDWWQSVAPFAQAPVNLLVVPPTEEPLTLQQGKLRAGLDWADGDPRDDLMKGFISVARERVEHDSGRALLTQTRRVSYDVLQRPVIELPALARPVQQVTAITTTDFYGVDAIIDPSLYVVDLEAGRIYFSWPGARVYWNLRPFKAWQIDVIVGRVDAADLLARDPSLVHAVGMLTAHYATTARDVAIVGTIVQKTPLGYEYLLEPYQSVTVA